MRAHAIVLRCLGALVLPGVVGVLFAEAQGCNPACSGPERSFSGGNSSQIGGVRVYETSPVTGPFLPFEGAADYHIRHGLGMKPNQIQIYLAFNEFPEDNGNGGSSGWAGNQGIILTADACEVRIRNDTCSDYWVRVVLTAYPGLDGDATTEADDASSCPPDDAGASDASTDSDAGSETSSDATTDADADAG
jgi:hypothetical protein